MYEEKLYLWNFKLEHPKFLNCLHENKKKQQACSKTAWPISHKNEWSDDFFFCIFVILFPYAPFLVSSYIPLS